MGKTLVIAEKPELGRAIASVLVGNTKDDKGIIENDRYIITWAFGHLLELCEPWDYDETLKKWDVERLPIVFHNWKKQPPKDKVDKKGNKQDNAYRRTRLFLIRDLLKRADIVIHAGDPDDEGQLLIDEILEYFHYRGTVKRVLINDNLPANIKKQFNNLKNNSDFKSISDSANARAMADKCFGVNHSRLASTRLGTLLYVGRVQTPTLNLVVQRDLSIENHQKQMYYELFLHTNANGFHGISFKFEHSKEFDEEKYILDKSRLESIGQRGKGKTLQSKFTNKEKLSAPPLPYNATELQADMNGRYGYSLKKTLDITQTLRDKYRAITYNRSDCQYLSEEHFKQAPHVISTVFTNIQKTYIVGFMHKSKCFDDSKVSAHHGIIPQDIKIDISKLTEDERNVYLAICERYIMQFMPPIKKMACEGIIPFGKQGRFVYRASKIIDFGYSKYFKNIEKDEEEESNRFIPEGTYQTNVEDYSITEKETKPLPRYTPKTLIKDMCGISKYVKDPVLKQALKDKDKDKVGEHGSIGTIATRASIIDDLITVGFLEMKGKNVISTPKGREFIRLLPDDIKSADTTAKWWLIQEQIKDDKQDVNAVMDAVVEDFRQKKDTLYVGVQMKNKDGNKAERKSLGKCPKCGKEIFESKSKKDGTVFYGCSGYKDGCTFSIPNEIKYFNDVIKMTASRVSTLLKGGTIKAEVSAKNGNKYKTDFKLVLKEWNGRTYLNLERVKSSK